MSFIIFAVAALIRAFEFIERIPSLSAHLVCHIDQKKKVQRRKVRRKGGLRNWPSSSYPFIWGIHIKTVTDSVSKMNKRAIQLNEIVVVELRKSLIFQHIQERIACNDVLIKEEMGL
jgi:hypothetical protein